MGNPLMAGQEGMPVDRTEDWPQALTYLTCTKDRDMHGVHPEWEIK